MRFTKGSKIIATKKERKRKDERERKKAGQGRDRQNDRQTDRKRREGKQMLAFSEKHICHSRLCLTLGSEPVKKKVMT